MSISKKFIELLPNDLSITDASLIVKIIDFLFSDLSDGHSCSDLAYISHKLNISLAKLHEVLLKSTLVHYYGDELTQIYPKPLSMWRVAGRELLYITKYLSYEYRVANKIKSLINSRVNALSDDLILQTLMRLNQRDGLPNKEQIKAIEYSCQNKFSIITGGPGTGKTTTVVLLLWALFNHYGADLNVQICAPTGKAAIRVRDSILANITRLQTTASDLINLTCFAKLIADSSNFSTIHKLLGSIPNSIYFRHDQNNPLDCEVLIIDESSMVGLPLFSKLLDAIDNDVIKHIIFLGDKNQLSSVEEGYVFSSLVDLQITHPNNEAYDLFNQFVESSIAQELIETKRSNSEILSFATALLAGESDKALAELQTSNSLALYEPKLQILLSKITHEESGLLQFINYMQQVKLSNLEVKEIFNEFVKQSTLCITNTGILGSNNVNLQIERKIKLKLAFADEWYSGRPIIILQNDYTLELFNGDIGICIIENNETRVVFENGKQLIPELLPRYALAYAITVHKSQGSEYDSVNIVIPDVGADSNLAQLLSRSLLYTAVTRAKKCVTIFAARESLEFAIANNMLRTSGLLQMF